MACGIRSCSEYNFHTEQETPSECDSGGVFLGLGECDRTRERAVLEGGLLTRKMDCNKMILSGFDE